MKKVLKKTIKLYSVSLKIAGKEYKAKGESVSEALGSMGLSWDQIKSKGVMTVKKGFKSHEHLFFIKQLKRIFANKITRSTWGKRLELFLQ
jgi:hypothetical protein